MIISHLISSHFTSSAALHIEATDIHETFHFTSRLASVEQYGMKLYGLCAAGLWMYCFVGHAGRGMVVLCFNQSFDLAVRRVRLFLRYDTPCYRCCYCRSTSNDQ